MGRTAAGVRGINLGKTDIVVGAVVVRREKTSILVVSEHGFGKRSELEEYRVSHRGGKGIFTLKATDKTGTMVAIKEVLENDDIVLVTAKGIIIRQPAKSVRLSGRNTQGVRLIRLEPGDHTAAVAIVRSEDDENGGSDFGKAAEKKNGKGAADPAQLTLEDQAQEQPPKKGGKPAAAKGRKGGAEGTGSPAKAPKKRKKTRRGR
jgi:hypothetical protein